MANDKMTAQISGKPGFIAALDQSGGSTPNALRLYGVAETLYDDAEMFHLVHQMRERIMTAPSFTGGKVLAAILFEGTMDGRSAAGPAYLWENGVVPILKVDKGLEAESGGQPDEADPGLDALLERAKGHGIFGTKMPPPSPSRPKPASPRWWPSSSRGGADRPRPGADHRAGGLNQQPGQSRRRGHASGGTQPAARRPAEPESDAQADASGRSRSLPAAEPAEVARVVALSGGYTRAEACARLAANQNDRELLAPAGRRPERAMSDAEFDAALAIAIDEIYRASTVKA